MELSTVELLTMCKRADAAQGGKGSDYSTAIRLGWYPQRFGALLVGVRKLNDAEVVDAATLAGVPVPFALASIRAEHSEGSVAHRHWRTLADALDPEKEPEGRAA